MALDNLRAFLGALEARGEVTHVAHPVSVDRQITEVADRCMKSPGGGPALLFERPTLPSGAPARYPVAVNLFGSGNALGRPRAARAWARSAERTPPPLTIKAPTSLLAKTGKATA